MEEVWKDIKEYEGLYQISNMGNVMNCKKRKKLSLINKDYFYVFLSKNGNVKMKSIHRLVAQAFIPNPLNKKEVNHIDGNKHNNYVDNLEWVTREENMKHAFQNHLYHTEKPVLQIKNGIVINEYKSLSNASYSTRLNLSTICNALKGRYKKAGGFIWKYK